MASLVGSAETVEVERIAFGAPIGEFLGALERSGVVIIDDVLSRQQVDQINAEFEAHMESIAVGPSGGDEFAQDFFGKKTRRVTSAVSISETYRSAFLENDKIWEYALAPMRQITEHIRLSIDAVFEIHPGEKAQMLHRDGDLIPYFGAMGPDGPAPSINLIIALSDITEEMGATRVIPGSHKWPATDLDRDFNAQFADVPTVPVTVKAGTVYVVDARVVHGGGANRTADTKRRILSCTFCPAWVIPEHAYLWSVSKELAATFSPRLRMATLYGSVHHRQPLGGSLWNFNFNDLSEHLKF